MISTTGGSSCCTRKASMIATMENHCQRVRRNLSRRFEGRNKLPKLAFWLEPCGARARMHTTAKNPASRSSSNASLSIFFSKPWESTLLAGKNITALAGWEQYSPPVLVTAELLRSYCTASQHGAVPGSRLFATRERAHELCDLQLVRGFCGLTQRKSNSNFL